MPTETKPSRGLSLRCWKHHVSEEVMLQMDGRCLSAPVYGGIVEACSGTGAASSVQDAWSWNCKSGSCHMHVFGVSVVKSSSSQHELSEGTFKKSRPHLLQALTEPLI